MTTKEARNDFIPDRTHYEEIVLCGSTSAYPKVMDLREQLAPLVKVTVPPGVDKEQAQDRSQEEAAEAKRAADAFRYYYRKIQESDAILVVNEEKYSIEGYIGPNTLIEMAFAHVLEKQIFLLNPLPGDDSKLSWLPELRAIGATDLEGNIDSLKEYITARTKPIYPIFGSVELDAEADPRMNLQQNSGRLRVVAVELMPDYSLPLKSLRWQSPAKDDKSWIYESGAKRFEVSTFNQLAKQDRHYHREATEIYTVLAGRMAIWVQGDIICLDQGG